MKTDLREFTVDEANALVPALHRLVARQMLVQDAIQERAERLHALTGALPRELVPRPADAGEVRTLKEELGSLLHRLEEGWGEVHALGVVVKDPRTGLVDFYGRVGGERVFLCWRFGEEAIRYYHALDQGFDARKAIGAEPERHRLLS